MPATCPRCKRNVVASRPTCLYCGAPLVEKTAAGAPDDEVKRRMQKASTDPAELVAQGNAEMRAGRTEKALLIYRQVLSIRPDHAPVMSNTAAAFLRMDRHEESVVSATEALLANPGLAPAFANLALAWLGIGKSEAALEAWMRAQELDPRLAAPPLVALSKAFAEANAIYRAAIAALAAAKPVRARSLFMELVSRKLARAAERSDAGKRLETIASELARWDAAAWLSQARLMRKDGQAELSVGCFDEVLRLEPDQPEALMQKRAGRVPTRRNRARSKRRRTRREHRALARPSVGMPAQGGQAQSQRCGRLEAPGHERVHDGTRARGRGSHGACQVARRARTSHAVGSDHRRGGRRRRSARLVGDRHRARAAWRDRGGQPRLREGARAGSHNRRGVARARRRTCDAWAGRGRARLLRSRRRTGAPEQACARLS